MTLHDLFMKNVFSLLGIAYRYEYLWLHKTMISHPIPFQPASNIDTKFTTITVAMVDLL